MGGMRRTVFTQRSQNGHQYRLYSNQLLHLGLR